ncbi:acyl-CoA desaturase [Anaeromyxobacter sp. Fw109-5]|uniref:acyl-CoA desaturase n=1 Tax=Anaeromyxobacter sp. (strain Fw109-5) TaxID=404589 RepID=UPI0000ED8A0F|nr:acyl-CoA desaturase [Anaeromyxobacter sp. Fw109-5]ABS26288.1 Stearoyl-CoA 9-desaturase [Anaeromyxobacter sp. Fw109-5]
MPATRAADVDAIAWTRSLPFFAVHAVALATPFLAPVEGRWVALAIGLYLTRMFGITAGYHRYFSHRAFRTSRGFQLVLAVLGASSAQKGPLWWAAHHRDHHRHSDRPPDIHSPLERGFWWSHVGWILARRHDATKLERVKDLARYPELRWLDRWHLAAPLALAGVLLLAGGVPALLWGFFVSTVLLWHGTFAINSLAHVFGRRRYETGEGSRNGLPLALLTLGEGWHNNHHFYPSSANQGFFWWEVDVTYYVLRGLSVLRVVRDLRTPPDRVRYAHRAAAEPAARSVVLQDAG